MNTTNISMASWSAKDAGSCTASGLQQGGINSAGQDGSVFQQMIARITAMNSQNNKCVVQENAAQSENSVPAGESGNLMELLFSVQNSGVQELVNSDGSAEPTEENGALEILLAMMTGMPAAALNPGLSGSTSENQTAALPGQSTDGILGLNQAAVLHSQTEAQGVSQGLSQDLIFGSGTLFTQNAEAAENTARLTMEGSSGRFSEAGERLFPELAGAGEIKTNLKGVNPLHPEAVPAESTTGFQNLLDGENETVDLTALKNEMQFTGGLRSEKAGAIAEETTLNQFAAAGKTAAADEKNHDGAGQTSATQDFLNAVHYTDPVNESGTLNQSVQNSGKTEQYSQISDEILSRLEQKNSNEFRMQLQPEELGQIDIKLKLNEGKLIIDILAANSKTQALLTNQVDKLIASMGLQNVQVESVNVSQQMNHQGSDGQNQWQNMNFEMDFSQRRNQEQLKQELNEGSSRTGLQGASQIEAQETGSATIQNLRQYNNLHRLNYAV